MIDNEVTSKLTRISMMVVDGKIRNREQLIEQIKLQMTDEEKNIAVSGFVMQTIDEGLNQLLRHTTPKDDAFM